MTNTADLIRFLPFIIPLVVVQLAFMITALVHILTHPTYRFCSKPVWVVVVIVFNFIGPLTYFIFGRGKKEA